jgi:hypothetical protein
VSVLGGALRILSPRLCDADDKDADAFVAGLAGKVPARHLEMPTRDSELGAPGPDDVVVALIPSAPGARWRLKVEEHLERTRVAGADAIPVAMRRTQQPPAPLADLAPLLVPDIFDSYHLAPSQFYEAGAVFARIAMSRLWPTYSREQLRLFLSHRRTDGEALVRRLASAIHDLNHSAARDLADIRPGTRIGARIVEELDESDAFVLCDTPLAAGEHDWLKDELCVALGLAIPIVWARFGQAGSRSALLFAPGDQPDLDVDWPDEIEGYHSVAAQIIDMAFVAGRNQVRRVEACLAQAQETAQVDVLDGRRRILLLERARSFGPFPLSERIVVQAYARRPTREDGEALRNWLLTQQMMSADRRWRSFDLALLMGPAPVCNRGVEGASAPVSEVEGVHYTHAAAVVTALREQPGTRPPGDRPELLLFAALGPGQGAGQEFRDAVLDVATYWLGRGGRIRFGGHPTVTPTVHWVARAQVPGQEQERVTIYQSEYFVTPQLLREISRISQVVGTEVRGTGDESRRASLTHMRERMVLTSSAVAAVVIGGMTRAERDEQPGVEEEMLLARAHGIAAFLLGATGGQAAVMADQARTQDPPFSGLGNSLSSDANDFLTTTDDYSRAIEMIWTATVGA